MSFAMSSADMKLRSAPANLLGPSVRIVLVRGAMPASIAAALVDKFPTFNPAR